MVQSIIMSSKVVNPGGKYVCALSGWQPIHTIRVTVTNTTTQANITVNGIGDKTFIVQIPTNFISGSYTLSAQDPATGDAATFSFSANASPIDPPVAVFQSYSVPLYGLEDDLPTKIPNRRTFLVKNIGHVPATISIRYLRRLTGSTTNIGGTLTTANLEPGALMTYSSNTQDGNYVYTYSVHCAATNYTIRETDRIQVNQNAGVGGVFSGTGPGATGQGELIDVIQPLLSGGPGSGGGAISQLTMQVMQDSGNVNFSVQTTPAFSNATINIFVDSHDAGLHMTTNNSGLATGSLPASNFAVGPHHTFAQYPATPSVISNQVTFTIVEPGPGPGDPGPGGILGGLTIWFNKLSSNQKLGFIAVLGAVALASSSGRRGGINVVRA